MSRIARTPDRGYKFKCTYCEDDVYQESLPQLCILVQESGSGRDKTRQSLSHQACQDCVRQIEKENAKLSRRRKDPERQVLPLRAEFQTQDKVVARDDTSAKLDKLTDAIANLTNLLLMQVQANAPLQPPKSQKRAEDQPVRPPATAGGNTGAVPGDEGTIARRTARKAPRPNNK